MTDPLLEMAPMAELVADLIRAQQTVAAAESLTAGLFCAAMASVPGASEVLRGGVVAYATDLKASLADVAVDVLDRVGPVAAETAAQLARGAQSRCIADWGIGLTGVAGPAAQGGVIPGSVFLGIAGPRIDEVIRLTLPGDRWDVRVGAVAAAVAELRRLVRGSTDSGTNM